MEDQLLFAGDIWLLEGKKWKCRWCVIRKLSPVADGVCVCVRRTKEGPVLRGERWGVVGVSWGWPYKGRSHTLALMGPRGQALHGALADRAALLALAARLRALLHGPTQYDVAVQTGPGLARSEATLCVSAGRVALLGELPPRLIRLWDIAHLRRFGVVEGRVCLEGGAQSGPAEGLTVLVAACPYDVVADIRGQSAAAPSLPAAASIASRRASRSESRLDDFDEDDGGSCDAWPSSERPVVPRCSSCMAALGSLMRPSASFRPFQPSWRMKPPPLPSVSAEVGAYDNYDVPRSISEQLVSQYDRPGRLRGACGALYATVDVARKARRRAPGPHYENVCSAPRQGAEPLYLAMGPHSTVRAASQPSLVEPLQEPLRRLRCASVDSARESESPLEAAVAVDPPAKESACRAAHRSSSSSADSGVCIRRTEGSCSASEGSDYVESLSLCSSQSSEPPTATLATNTLRPRSGQEYRPAASAASTTSSVTSTSSTQRTRVL